MAQIAARAPGELLQALDAAATYLKRTVPRISVRH